MYNFSDKEASKLVILSIGLDKIAEKLKDVSYKRGLDKVHKETYVIQGKQYNAIEIISMSRSKLQAIQEIREIYNQIGDKYKSILGKDLGDFLRDYSNEKIN